MLSIYVNRKTKDLILDLEVLMKKLLSQLFIVSGLLVSFYACQSKTAKGAVAGGAVGAGAFIAGGQGAIIGAAVGTTTGALIGYSLDSAERARVEESSPKTLTHIDKGDRLSVHDVITLHQCGLSDAKIKDLIKQTNSTYTLNTRDIHKLENAGVSNDVMCYMMKKNHQ